MINESNFVDLVCKSGPITFMFDDFITNILSKVGRPLRNCNPFVAFCEH